MQHQPLIDEMHVERHLARRGIRLRFSDELETQYEAETSLARSRLLVVQGVAGFVFYLLHSFTDLALIPDIVPLALMLHLGVSTPLMLIALTLYWFNSPPPLRDQLATSTATVMLFITVIQRARLPYAIFGCVVLFAANVVALSLLPGYEPERLLSSIGTLVGSAVLMLVATWLLERETRQAYLLRLKERLLNTALDDMSRHDPMTGLENRRALELAFAAIDRDANRGEDIAVVLLDIDHFKAYNDALGHMAGDEALRQVARELRAGLRAGTDRAFRFGGEEFLLLLRRTSLSEAVSLAERLRRRIEAAALPHPRGEGMVVTASFGAASARTGGDIGNDELVAGADAALYAAKRNGRNQVWPQLRATRPDERPVERPVRDAG
ncbi:MAG: GGDEF domain-containing protein [Devosia sp.]|nr:GGDEF domain-containing protein [Devosia sp.]